MRILLAGGVYSLPPDARARKRPAPEEVLAAGLREAGEDVYTISLKDFKAGIGACKYDVVHVHHMSKMAVMQALLPGTMVFTPHSSTYGLTIRRRNAERIVWTKSDAVVCLSENERRDKVDRLPMLAGRTFVIPNGIPPLTVSHQPELRQWQDGDEFNVAVVGQLIRVKRIHLAIQALTQLPSYVRLHLTYHNSHLENELRSLTSSLGLQDRVFFLGQAGGDELYQRFQSAHLLLMPSYAEALPSVVSEALITGCPIIATDVGGIREQIGGPAGILVDRDIANYSSAIRAAMARYGEYARAAFARGLELERLYSPAMMASKHIELYKTVLDRA
ncbi:glycosyltransferase family 4 protein [Blastococcus sp. SYSU D00922]